MNTTTLRNALLVVGAVAIPIVALVVIGTILNVLAPLAITAAVAFVLGRLSVNFNLIEFIKKQREQQQAAAEAKTVEKAAAVLQKTETVSAKPAPKTAEKAPAAAAPPPAEPKTRNDLLDPTFEIKTPEQIEAEAKQREQELMQRTVTPSADSVAAALEERRKRLLGSKPEGES
ncbi:MAG: hypothetical protein K8L97_28880 [Anaerolineae bacterium]|nr:hypothetical protein [Anaerolineae bacterium]